MSRKHASYLVLSLVLPLLVVLAQPGPAAAAPGPELQASKAALRRSLSCTDDVGRPGARRTVLLVHGTGATPKENWSWNLGPKLRERGYPSCRVTIPDRGWGDVQGNVEYVVHAIRATYRRSGGPIAVIGHSQGALLPTYALRVWPDLAAKVDDFIGFAGVYTYGTDIAEPLCAASLCSQAAHQFRPGSRLLTELSERPLPRGPSYTGFLTRYDELVQPQPKGSAIAGPGARNYVLQELCPADIAEHITILAERPFLQLTFDALSHRGPARLGRIQRLRCGFDPGIIGGLPVLPTFGIGFGTKYVAKLTTSEPPLRRYWRR